MVPYELCEEYQMLQEALETAYQNSSEPPLPIGEWYSAKTAPLTTEQRIEQLVRWDRNNDGEVNGISSEIKRLQERLRGAQRRADMVREYLMGSMLAAGLKKHKTPIGTVSICQGRERVVVDYEQRGNWPDDIRKAVVTPQPDKISVERLKSDFKDRLKDLPGVSVECGDDYLVIR